MQLKNKVNWVWQNEMIGNLDKSCFCTMVGTEARLTWIEKRKRGEGVVIMKIGNFSEMFTVIQSRK